MVTLGIIGDTHIPDRATALPQQALDLFAERQVKHILHTGDISRQRILDQLEEVAPVIAVRGNLDFFGFKDLPMHRTLTYEGVTIGMTHGHMNWTIYLVERTYAYITGPMKMSVFEKKVLRKFPDTDIVLFGHTHIPLNRMVGKQLLFNPGSATWPNLLIPGLKATIGFLQIENTEVTGEIVSLG